MNAITKTRSLETVTAEIITITAHVRREVLSGALELGRRLVEAKELVPRGEWGKYLEEQVAFSASQAGNFMRLYNEYGDKQESLFGGGLQAIENLSVTSAIRLLSLPADEREVFVEENDVSEMTTRELEKAIRERNEAREAQKNAEEAAKASSDALQKAETDAAEAKQRAAALDKKLLDAQKDARKAREALERQKTAPMVPDDLMARIRQDAEKTAAEASAKEAADKLRKLEDARAMAEKKAAAAEAALEEARRQSAFQDPQAAVFKVLFGQVQEDFNQMFSALGKVQDPALAEKLRGAVRKLLESLEGRAGA